MFIKRSKDQKINHIRSEFDTRLKILSRKKVAVTVWGYLTMWAFVVNSVGCALRYTPELLRDGATVELGRLLPGEKVERIYQAEGLSNLTGCIFEASCDCVSSEFVSNSTGPDFLRLVVSNEASKEKGAKELTPLAVRCDIKSNEIVIFSFRINVDL